MAALALRVACGAFLLLLLVAYVLWLCGEYLALARRIWAPVVWIVQNPPDPTLTVITAAVVLTALFFEPAHDFISELEEGLGLKRRQKVETIMGENPPDTQNPPMSEGPPAGDT